MKIKFFGYFIFCVRRIFLQILIGIFLILAFKNYVYGASEPKIFVRIESFDKTIAADTTNAYTFLSAIDKIANDNGVQIVFSQSGANVSINSVDGIKNDIFEDGDKWLGYVKRNNLILSPNDFLNQSLKNNDEVVLYYGKPEFTQRVSDININDNNGKLTMIIKVKLFSENTIIEKTLNNVKIYLTDPEGRNKILITNNSGTALTTLYKLGVYSYLFQDSRSNSCPNVVKSGPFYYFHGLSDYYNVTRAEAAAFIVNQMHLKKNGNTEVFLDVQKNHPYFEEIEIALSNKIISGYGDGYFHPDEKINLMQFSVMLSNILEDDNLKAVEGIDSLPPWAKSRLSNVIYYGLLSEINLNFDRNISGDELIIIYKNLIKRFPF